MTAKTTTLTAANAQWANRPAEQRFSSLQDLHLAVQHHRDVAVEAVNVDLTKLRVDMQSFGGEVAEPVLVGETGKVAQFTNNGFRQLCSKIGVPANYMRELPGELVMANMNYGLSTVDNGTNNALLFAKNGSMRLRSALSNDYMRIWNSDITTRLIKLSEDTNGMWQPAPAAFDGSRGL